MLIAALFFAPARSAGYSVSNLTASCSSGQVFLTWNNPDATNLQYNVYRSTTKFTASSQLNTATYLGFVRDKSSKNLRLSEIFQEDIYFQIEDGEQPLSPDQGLYVATCTNNQSFYYAVTITDLSTGKESKKLTPGKNTLALPVAETVSQPLPVYQYSDEWSQDDVVDRYVQFVNNQETSLYPAMNSTGSYGFNFYLLKRGSTTNYPLFVVYEGLLENSINGNGLDEFENHHVTDCYILGVDDWLPVPKKNGDIGDNAYWCCYHEDYNIYSIDNPLPESGLIKLFPQKRYIAAIDWAKDHFPIDANRVYTLGVSAGGYGALLTAAIIPEQIAAVYCIVEPLSIGPNGMDVYEQMWGLPASNLNTDVTHWNTGNLLSFDQLSDMRIMLDINERRALPLIFDIHGRNDHSVGWSPGKVEWLDSLQSNKAGGIFYWDQREHSGKKANFLDSEITPDFYRYRTDRSYPAFSNCSVNQDPGTGNGGSGAKYGAINGYLDWDDDITDEVCNYEVNIFLKDLYVGGVLDPDQFNNSTTDITFRRLQHFHPGTGAIIKWKNFDASNTKIQNGSIIYNDGLITLTGIKVNKSGNRIELNISGCERFKENTEVTGGQVYFTQYGNGYQVHAEVTHAGDGYLKIYDITGKMVKCRNVQFVDGSNIFEIPWEGAGIFLVQLEGPSLSYVEKLGFF